MMVDETCKDYIKEKEGKMKNEQTLLMIQSIYDIINKQKFPDGSTLLQEKYDDENESALSIEEMLKGFENLDSLAFMMGMDKDFSSDADEVNHHEFIAKKIISIVKNEEDTIIEDKERLKKHINTIISNFGSLFKLGLSPEEVLQALSISCEEKFQKVVSE